MYQAIGIRKSVEKRTLLHDISLSCGSGECVAVIGPNGSGKTVLLKALSLADPPSEGRIELDKAIYDFPRPAGQNLHEPWPDLTFVFQQLFLWPHLTLQANIAMPAEAQAHDSGLVRKRVRELSSELALDDLLSRYPNQVSGGQRQRVAIARALVLKPRWLLLDEPNSAQDVEQIGLLSSLFLRLKSEGVGIIFSTHLLGFAGGVADRVVFLDGGRQVEQGTAEILSNPKTDRMKKFVSIVGPAKSSSGDSR
jgi:ABC-type polar amino acid transport system ATPase subunit